MNPLVPLSGVDDLETTIPDSEFYESGFSSPRYLQEIPTLSETDECDQKIFA